MSSVAIAVASLGVIGIVVLARVLAQRLRRADNRCDRLDGGLP